MKVKIIFAPEPDTPNLTFVEVEDMDGRSVSVGEWLPKDDRGYSALVLELAETDLLRQRDELLQALQALIVDDGQGAPMSLSVNANQGTLKQARAVIARATTAGN